MLCMLCVQVDHAVHALCPGSSCCAWLASRYDHAVHALLISLIMLCILLLFVCCLYFHAFVFYFIHAVHAFT